MINLAKRRNMKKETKSFVRGIVWFLALTVVDQLTKYAAVAFLKSRKRIDLIPGVFELFYLENRGAAFGIMRGRQFIFIVIALLITICLAFLYRRIPCEKRYVPLKIICVSIAAGAMGNMIDRLFHTYVIDFLYFSLIDFPVFNVADCYVTIGVGLLIILLVTFYKDEPFDFLNPSYKKEKG